MNTTVNSSHNFNITSRGNHNKESSNGKKIEKNFYVLRLPKKNATTSLQYQSITAPVFISEDKHESVKHSCHSTVKMKMFDTVANATTQFDKLLHLNPVCKSHTQPSGIHWRNNRGKNRGYAHWTLCALICLLFWLATSKLVNGVSTRESTQTQPQSQQDGQSIESSSSSPSNPIFSSSLLSSHSSSLLYAPSTLLIEELLQEQSLEEAINKLTNVWNRVHGKNQETEKNDSKHFDHLVNESSQMISTKQVKLAHLATTTTTTENSKKSIRQKSQSKNQNINSRSRRWIHNVNDTANRTTTNTEHKVSDGGGAMMLSEDSRIYVLHSYTNHVNQTYKSNGMHLNKANTQSSPIPPSLPPPPNAAAAANEKQTSKTCSGCKNKEKSRMLRIENVKLTILSKLGMTQAPNISKTLMPKIPPIEHLLGHHRRADEMMGDDPVSGDRSQLSQRRNDEYFGPLVSLKDELPDDFHVNTERTIVFAQSPPADRQVEPSHRAQYFKFPTNVLNSQVSRAVLWVYVKGSGKPNINGTIMIYQIVRGSPSLLTIHEKAITKSIVKNGGWVKISVKRLVTKWFHHMDQNLGLSIHSYDKEGKPLTIIHSSDASFESAKRPFIDLRVITKSPESVRRKRMATLTCSEKSTEIRCCRYPLTIDFDTFGWDWIIAPKRYEANYCNGECSMVWMSGYPHTHLVAQTGMFSPPTGACCSPRKMSAISMLYMDADYNIIYGILPNMVVDKCDCS